MQFVTHKMLRDLVEEQVVKAGWPIRTVDDTKYDAIARRMQFNLDSGETATATLNAMKHEVNTLLTREHSPLRRFLRR